MNIGLLVDTSCDLPQSIYDRYQIHLLPGTLQGKSTLLQANRAADQNTETLSSKTVQGLTYKAPSREVFHKLLLDDLLYRYDHLLIMTPHIRLSDTLTNVREEVFLLQPQFASLRKQANLTAPFKIRVIETNSGFAGYGLMLYETLRLLHEKARSVDQLKQPLDRFRPGLQCRILPGQKPLAEPPFNLSWLQQQKNKLSKTVPLLEFHKDGIETYGQVAAENSQNLFFEQIGEELTSCELQNHLVNVSYAGKLAKLRVLPKFQQLHDLVKSKGGKLVHSTMSPGNIVQLGQEALCVAYSVK